MKRIAYLLFLLAANPLGVFSQDLASILIKNTWKISKGSNKFPKDTVWLEKDIFSTNSTVIDKQKGIVFHADGLFEECNIQQNYSDKSVCEIYDSKWQLENSNLMITIGDIPFKKLTGFDGVLKYKVDNYGNKLMLTKIDSKPSIFLNDGRIEWENFPAISSDGKILFVIDAQYSLAVSAVELHLIDFKTGKVIKKIVLTPGDENTNQTFSSTKNKAIVSEALSLIKKEKPKPLQSITQFEMSLDSSSKLFYLKFINNSVQKYSQLFNLEEMSRSWYCCGFEKPEDGGCKQPPEISEVWLAVKNNFLLVVYGFSKGADGCESGPSYKIVPLKAEK